MQIANILRKKSENTEKKVKILEKWMIFRDKVSQENWHKKWYPHCGDVYTTAYFCQNSYFESNT